MSKDYFDIENITAIRGATTSNGNTSKEVLMQQKDRSQFFANPRDLNPSIPVDVEKIILKCIEFEVINRYPHITYLVADLRKALYV